MTNAAHRKPFLEISFHSFPPFFPEPDTADISRYRSQLKLRSPGLLALNISLEPKNSKHLMLSNCMSFPDTSFQWMCTGPCMSLKAVAERADLTELDGPFFHSAARMLTAIPGLSTQTFAFDAVKLPGSIGLLCLCVLPTEQTEGSGSQEWVPFRHTPSRWHRTGCDPYHLCQV